MTRSSPRPVLSAVISRPAPPTRVPSIRIVSSPEPLQIVMPSRKSPAARKLIAAGARPAIQMSAFGARRGSRSQRGRADVGDQHVAVAGARHLVADHQRVAAGAEVEVERAGDRVEVAAQVVRPRVDADVREVRHVDALVAVVERHVGDRQRALDVEHVVALAERDVERLEAVVVDAVDAADV